MIKSLNLFIQAARYEQWLEQQEANINNQLKYYETEIAKLRKQKKVSLYNLIKIYMFAVSFDYSLKNNYLKI